MNICLGRYGSHRFDGHSACMRKDCSALNPKFYPGVPPTMTDQGVIDAIHTKHLKANIDGMETAGFEMQWEKAWIDPGGTIFGLGPYAKVPCRKQWDRDDYAFFKRIKSEPNSEWDERVIRVYPPERLRQRLARHWARAQ